MNKYCWTIGETGEIDLCIKAKDITEAREKLMLSFGHDITRLIQSRHTLHVETVYIRNENEAEMTREGYLTAFEEHLSWIKSDKK